MKKGIREFVAVALTSIIIVYIFTIFLDKQYEANIVNNKFANSNKVESIEKDENIEIVEDVQNDVEEEKIEDQENVESLGQKIVDFAIQFVGNPYVYGGNSLTNGTDCSGFVKLIFQNFGIDLPRTTNGQATSGTYVSLSDRQPGDIVSYGYDGQATHSAIYIGDDRVVHAATPSRGITYGNLFMMNIIAVRRVI